MSNINIVLYYYILNVNIQYSCKLDRQHEKVSAISELTIIITVNRSKFTYINFTNLVL